MPQPITDRGEKLQPFRAEESLRLPRLRSNFGSVLLDFAILSNLKRVSIVQRGSKAYRWFLPHALPSRELKEALGLSLPSGDPEQSVEVNSYESGVFPKGELAPA